MAGLLPILRCTWCVDCVPCEISINLKQYLGSSPMIWNEIRFVDMSREHLRLNNKRSTGIMKSGNSKTPVWVWKYILAVDNFSRSRTSISSRMDIFEFCMLLQKKLVFHLIRWFCKVCSRCYSSKPTGRMPDSPANKCKYYGKGFMNTKTIVTLMQKVLVRSCISNLNLKCISSCYR